MTWNPYAHRRYSTFAKATSAAFLMVVLVAATAGAQTQQRELTIPYPAAGAYLGMGYNTFSGVTRETCIDPATGVLGDGTNAQQVTSKLSIVDDAQSITDILNVSLQGSFSEDTGIESGGADFSTDMENSVTINKHVVNLVASVEILAGSKGYATSPTLSATRTAQYTSNYAAFRQDCGDYWIKSIELGGVFYGTVSVLADSTEEQTKVAAALSAYEETPVVTASVSASLSSDLTTAASSSQLTINQFSSGGSAIQSATDLGSMLTAYSNFPASVQTQPAQLRIVLSPYSAALPQGTAINAVGTSYEQAVASYGKLAVRQFGYALANDALGDIAKAPQNWYFESGATAALQGQIAGVQNAINNIATACPGNPGACVTSVNAFLGSDPGPASIEASPNYPVPIALWIAVGNQNLSNQQLSSGGTPYCLDLSDSDLRNGDNRAVIYVGCSSGSGGGPRSWGVNQQGGWIQTTINGTCLTYVPTDASGTMEVVPCATGQASQQWAFLKDGTIRNSTIQQGSLCVASTAGGSGSQSGYWVGVVGCDNTTAGGTIWTVPGT